jgi:outer membrane protein TolC
MARARWRWIAPGLALAVGCSSADSRLALAPDAPVVARGQSGDRPSALQPVKKNLWTDAPPASAPNAAQPVEKLAPPTDAHQVLPVTLDAVLRLAEGQNPQMALARERVTQAFAERDLADKRWLPEVNVGAGYYRHEGGIQDQDGTLVRSSTGAMIAGMDLAARLDLRAAAFAKLDAARRTWQQKGELHRVTTEVLLDAAGTYIDLLAAHAGLAIVRGLDADLRALQERAQKLANVERGARIEVVRIEAEIAGQQQLLHKLQGQARSASAKLCYLLGLDPCTEIVPADETLVAICLADADVPCCELVARANACGPGIKEMEAILRLIHRGMQDAAGPSRFMPVVTAQALEGGFGAGPNGTLDFANRFDLGVQARWNLTELLTADAQRRIGCSALAQAQLTYTDLKGKLTLAVQEARESILSGREQIRLAEQQITQARTALDLSDVRLREGIQGASYGEVLLAQRAVAAARANYLSVLRDYDKAQLRLMILTGCSCPCGPARKQ